MPLSRFEKLPEEKKATILDAATREFVANGYEGASLNRIISAAGISKGAMYYYFADKADIFISTVRRLDTGEWLAQSGVEDASTSGEFWTRLDAMFSAAMETAFAQPDLVGLGKAFYGIEREMWETGPIGEYMAEKMAEFTTILVSGQRCGAIRTDLPLAIMTQLWMSVNAVLEAWTLTQWETDDDAARRSHMLLINDIFKRIFRPVDSGESA